jgi:dTDP-glucose 4,6-dehydratase
MMTTVLVTGGAGFIGGNFVHYIAQKYPDYRIAVLDALTYAGSTDNLPPEMRQIDHPRMRFWYGDVVNAELVNTLVADADYVVHFAAETHVTRSIFDNRLFFHTDVMGAHTVANAVLKSDGRVRRFIHISSSEVYGTAEKPLMDEEHPLKPMSPYASAKCGADRLVYSYWATYRIPATIIRPFNTFGPRQHLEKVIPRFITSALLKEKLTVHGTGAAARDFVFVEDVCRGIDTILHADAAKVDGEVLNLATGQHRTILSIAQDVLRLMGGRAGEIVYHGDRPGQVLRHSGDASKINALLGWAPSMSWEQGLKATIDWYTANRHWWEKHIWMRQIPIVTAAGRKEYH